MLTIEGRPVAYARLGQCRGMRAVRLNEKMPAAESLSKGGPDFTTHPPSPSKPGLELPDPDVIERILRHIGQWDPPRGPPSPISAEGRPIE